MTRDQQKQLKEKVKYYNLHKDKKEELIIQREEFNDKASNEIILMRAIEKDIKDLISNDSVLVEMKDGIYEVGPGSTPHSIRIEKRNVIN